MLSYSRLVMQLSVQSVFSAAEGAVGGGTIIPFVITTALDSIPLMTNTSNGHVLLESLS